MPRRAIILVVLALAGLGALGFFMLRPDPQTLLRKAQRKLVTENAMHLDVEARVALPPEDLAGDLVSVATGVDIVMRTDLDFFVILKPASRTEFEIVQGAGASASKLAGESRRKEGRHYMKLDETGRLEADVASRVKGKWIVSDRPFLDFVIPPDERALAEKPLDVSGVVAMGVALAEVDLFRVTKALPDDEIGGAKARHYAVELDMEAVSALLLKLRELRTGRPVEAEDVLAVTETVLRWGQPMGEVWVAKRGGKFAKIELVTALDGDGSSGAVGGAVTFSKFGQRPVIEAPQAEEIEDVLGPIFTKRLDLAGGREIASAEPPPSQGLGISAKEQAVVEQNADADGDGLTDVQEFFYGADAWNPDTDADGWSDGLEVEKGMNPIGPGTLYGFGL